ncbi:MAG: PEP-CTERM sorting domain-containing protein [Verrucomicrobia bacterium]|nr:PEP-CTERM sorting domain-containing protein [Verrucomicrobiota bacterium]
MKRNLTCLAVTLILSLGVSAHANITGQWDFNSGDTSATVGTALGDFGGTTLAATTFTTATIGGSSANVMSFPATTPTQGYIMTHGIAPNGGGLFVNQYTLIMDIMFPSTSSGVYRGLWQTSPANANDGDLFVNPGNGIGISSSYQGAILADTWHRVAFVFDLTLAANRLNKYIDGALVGSQNLSAGVDGRWALDSTALIFTDDDGETAAGFVNSIQIHDVALSANDIGLLGGATAAGIPVVPEPTSGLLLMAGMALLGARKFGWRK